MAANSSSESSTTANPPCLSSQYEIRCLTPEHTLWAAAIVAHSIVFHSPVVSKIFPDNKGKRFNLRLQRTLSSALQQIASGMSFGVFDRNFAYKHESSRANGGAFLWNFDNDDGTEEQILAAMDFPLVSVALAFDGFVPLEGPSTEPEIAPRVYRYLNELDPRGDSWKPTAKTQVLMRNGTNTRADYQGKGLMAELARFLMRVAKQQGYKAVSVVSGSDAVTHVWSNPRQHGMKGEIVAQFWTQDYQEKDDNDDIVNPFYLAKQRISRVHTYLDA